MIKSFRGNQFCYDSKQKHTETQLQILTNQFYIRIKTITKGVCGKKPGGGYGTILKNVYRKNRCSDEKRTPRQGCRNLGHRIIQSWETLKLWQWQAAGQGLNVGAMTRGWTAAKEDEQVAAISLGPACRCRGAPGVPKGKDSNPSRAWVCEPWDVSVQLWCVTVHWIDVATPHIVISLRRWQAAGEKGTGRCERTAPTCVKNLLPPQTVYFEWVGARLGRQRRTPSKGCLSFRWPLKGFSRGGELGQQSGNAAIIMHKPMINISEAEKLESHQEVGRGHSLF